MSQTTAQLISNLVQALSFTATSSAPANGVFLSAANTLAFATNSAQKLTINADGELGIGIASPTEALHIQGSAANTTNLLLKNTGNNIIYLTGDTVKTDASSSILQLRAFWNGNSVAGIRFITGTDTTNKDDGAISFFVRESGQALTEAMRLRTSGNLGIGKASPSNRLHVYHATTDLLALLESGDSRAAIGFEDNSTTTVPRIGGIADALYFFTGGTEKIRLTSTGNLGIGTTSPNFLLDVETDGSTEPTIRVHNTGTAASNDVRIRLQTAGTGATSQNARLEFGNADDTDNGLIRYYTGSGERYFAFSTNASEKMRLDTNGNLLLGTTTADAKLYVNGGTVLIKGNAAQTKLHLYHNSSGETAVTGSSPGLLLTAGSMNATNKYTPAIEFGSTDGAFTTTNPKVGALIVGRATETYGADTDSAMAMDFFTTGTNAGTGDNLQVHAMTLDGGQRLLIGRTASRSTRIGGSNLDPNIQIEGDVVGSASICRWNEGTNPSRFILQKGRGTGASPAIVQDDDNLGQIVFSGWDGDTFTNAAMIRAQVAGTPGDDDMPGRLQFLTTADGDLTCATRMTITETGNVGIGTAAPGRLLELEGGAPIIRFDDTGGGYSEISANTAILGLRADAGNTQSSSYIDFEVDGSEKARINASGMFMIGASTGGDTNPIFIKDQTSGKGIKIQQTGNQFVSLIADCNRTGGGNALLSIDGEWNGTVVSRIKLEAGSSTTNKDDGRISLSTKAGGTDLEEIVEINENGQFSIYGTAASASLLRLYPTNSQTTPSIDIRSSCNTSCGNILRFYDEDTSIAGSKAIGDIQFWSQDTGNEGIKAAIQGAADSTAPNGELRLQTDNNQTLSTALRLDYRGYAQFPLMGESTGTNVILTSSGYLQKESSSRRYKKNIKSIEDSMADKMLKCRPVWYQMNSEEDDALGHYGFIAEEVNEIDPTFVVFENERDGIDENGNPVWKDQPKEKWLPESVKYTNFIPLLLNLVKRQDERIKALEAKI